MGFERGFYIFFDPLAWCRVKKEWVLYYDQLEERGLADPANGKPDASAATGSGAPPGSASQADPSGTFGVFGDGDAVLQKMTMGAVGGAPGAPAGTHPGPNGSAASTTNNANGMWTMGQGLEATMPRQPQADR
jgi:hypothetical protein